MAKIKDIKAYEIIDSRGFPTLEGRLTLDTGQFVTASVPAGTSIGKYEAIELRDNNPLRFEGHGVLRAVQYVNELIGPKIYGVSPQKVSQIDQWLIKADNSANKSQLGANTLLLISILVTKAAAVDSQMPLYRYINQLYNVLYNEKIAIERIPTAIFNLINGGKHANNDLEFQEFQVIPSSSLSFAKSIEIVTGVFYELKRVLIYRHANVSVGEEGGFTPNFSSNSDGLEILNETIARKNLKVGLDIFLGLDIAASNFFKDGHYYIKDKPHPLKPHEYLDFLNKIIERYSILVLEDPLGEDDWDNWKTLFQSIKKETYLVGDDLLCTNKERLNRAIKDKACSSIIIKPNQIGTISETLEVVNIARKNDINCIVSHRSGETNDDFIADFAVGIQSDFVKFGAPSRGERVTKYNRLWQIERNEKF